MEAPATDLFVYDLQRDVKIRLAGDSAAAEWRPVWTSDGRFIVFSNFNPGSLPTASIAFALTDRDSPNS